MKRYLLCALVGCTPAWLHAQFTDSLQHHVKYTATGVLNKTNGRSSYVLQNGLALSASKKKISYNTAFAWIYGEQSKAITNNDFTAHGDVNLATRNKHLYGWGLVNYDNSYSLKINYRWQAGAGLAYDIIDSPDVKINISNGILYEKGDLVDPAVGADRYQIPRNSFRLSYRFELFKILHVDGTHFFQPSLLEIRDHIVQSSSHVNVKLNKWLGLGAAVVYNKVSRTKRENLLITYGLTIEKYF